MSFLPCYSTHFISNPKKVQGLFPKSLLTIVSLRDIILTLKNGYNIYREFIIQKQTVIREGYYDSYKKDNNIPIVLQYNNRYLLPFTVKRGTCRFQAGYARDLTGSYRRRKRDTGIHFSDKEYLGLPRLYEKTGSLKIQHCQNL